MEESTEATESNSNVIMDAEIMDEGFQEGDGYIVEFQETTGVETDNNNKRRQILKIACGLCVLLSTSAIIIVGLVYVFSKINAPVKNFDAVTPAPSPKVGSVPYPPYNLLTDCSDNFIKFDGGIMKCWAACEPSKCCHEWTRDAENCFKENEDACSMYSICENIKDEYLRLVTAAPSLGPPTSPPSISNINITLDLTTQPPDLASLCSPESTANVEGRIMCDDECRSALCCVSKRPYNCFQSNKETCDAYSACWNNSSAAHSTDDDAVIDTLVKEVCQLEKLHLSENRVLCEKVCSSRSCCFSENNGCRKKHPEWCGAFVPCLYLDGFSGVDDGSDVIISDDNNSPSSDQTTLNPNSTLSPSKGTSVASNSTVVD